MDIVLVFAVVLRYEAMDTVRRYDADWLRCEGWPGRD